MSDNTLYDSDGDSDSDDGVLRNDTEIDGVPFVGRPNDEHFTKAEGHDFIYEEGLAGRDLSYGKFAGCNFTGTDLSRSKLRHADLRNTKLINVKLNFADLEGAKLDGATLE